ncbi:MAG: allantoinase AllB [Gemmatimonadaceae bacterium]
MGRHLIIRGRQVLVDGALRPASLRIRDGRIESLGSYDDAPSPTIDAADDIVMAGLVDTHVHVNEPGRTEWEGFATATRAAAAGGVTTIFDMPLNSIPATTTLAALDAKRAAANGRIAVNVGLIGGVVPGNAHDLAPLAGAGITLFKCFLVPSGVDEFPSVNEADLRIAMPILASLGATLMVHAELPEHIAPVPQGDPRRYDTYLASRPVAAETSAVALVIRLAREFGTHVHIVHVSSAETVVLVTEARATGVRITCETCPHYLFFSAAEIPDGRTEYKCAPPIRSDAEREALWRELGAGRIDLVASDHSPCPPALKGMEAGDFFQAWGGIASLQFGLPAMWHEARRRGHGVAQVAEWMSAAPARLAGLGKSKGALAPGFDADIVIWDPGVAVNVDDVHILHRHPVTPYHGRTLTGLVKATYVGGALAYGTGADAPAGRILT